MELSLKNLLLAGIGAMAVTYDKAEEMVGELVKKGELTVSQGRELNEELKRKIREKKEEAASSETAEKVKSMLSGLSFASKQDVEELRRRVDELEKK